MRIRYLGPAHRFGSGGRWIRRGELIELAEPVIRLLQRYGHRFEMEDRRRKLPEPDETPEGDD